MTQIEAAVAEYSKTILDLQTRLANAAIQIHGLMEQLEAKAKELDALKPKKLAAVPDASVSQEYKNAIAAGSSADPV